MISGSTGFSDVYFLFLWLTLCVERIVSVDHGIVESERNFCSSSKHIWNTILKPQII